LRGSKYSKNAFSVGANSVPLNPSAGFDGPLCSREREGKGKEGRGKERTESNVRDGKTPQNKLTVIIALTSTLD